MSSSLRSSILNQIAKSTESVDLEYMRKIASSLVLKFKEDKYTFELPLRTKSYDIKDHINSIKSNIDNDIFHSVRIEDNALSCEISKADFTKRILESNSSSIAPPAFSASSQNVVIDFSSPNIAKPFHLGHFRSTMLGNHIANMNNFLQHKVTRINYLGDWGKQFGFIQIGTKIQNTTDDDMKRDPIQTLYKSYVAAHKQLEIDPTVEDQAQEVFRQLELGDSDAFQNWELFKTHTVHELSSIYKRLGIVFDEYHWESMYRASKIKNVLATMDQMQLLSLDGDNRTVVHLDNNNAVPIKRSDDTTLYITRDIAAAIDRYEKYKFDVMYYVVDGAQAQHFNNLIDILKKMQMPWVDRLKHITFGRILGMSTRKGTSIFIEDILNELRGIMKEGQLKSETTKVSTEEMDEIADILAVTGLIMYDLKQRRERNYEFQLKDVIEIAKTGIGRRLQYTHCRLSSLEERNYAELVKECDPSCLKEPEIYKLLFLIGKFDEIVMESYANCQPSILTGYILRLNSVLGSLCVSLSVKGQPSDIASNRLLVLHVGRLVLAQCMRLLGITPLRKM